MSVSKGDGMRSGHGSDDLLRRQFSREVVLTAGEELYSSLHVPDA